jgi:hypothetical protein
MEIYIEKIKSLPYVLGVEIKGGDVFVNIIPTGDTLQTSWNIIQHIYDVNYTKHINRIICNISMKI